MSAVRPIAVLIVDDQNLFAESLKTFIHNYADDIRVVGIASDGREAVEIASQLQPAVVLMDVHMPRLNGVDATQALLRELPSLKVIMLSTYDEDEYVRQALSYGASGYLLKDISPTELIASIRALDSGVSQISPKLIRGLIQGAHATADTERDSLLTSHARWMKKLTKREREVFTLVATGYDNDQIADRLCISERTVRNHVSMIYAKLGIDNRFQIIQLANKVTYHHTDPHT